MYDGDRLPTSIGNILILEKVFPTFNYFPLQNGFYVNNSYANMLREEEVLYNIKQTSDEQKNRPSF